MARTSTPPAPVTHGLTVANEQRLVRLTEIAGEVDACLAQRDSLYRERETLIGDARLDDPPAPAQLLAEASGVSASAIQIVLRSEERKRGLTEGALGRARNKPANA